jgi:hypothetical protein
MNITTERLNILRKLFVVAALCLGAFVIVPALAAPRTDIYYLDLAPAITIDHGDNIAPPECAAVISALHRTSKCW